MNLIGSFNSPYKNAILLFSVAIKDCSYFDIYVLGFFMQINEFLQKFDNVKQLKEQQWSASCPVLHNHASGDQHQSLHIDYKNDKILIHCKVGCDTKEILESIDMSFKDLYTANNYTKDIKTHAEDWLSERGVFSHRINKYRIINRLLPKK